MNIWYFLLFYLLPNTCTIYLKVSPPTKTRNQGFMAHLISIWFAKVTVYPLSHPLSGADAGADARERMRKSSHWLRQITWQMGADTRERMREWIFGSGCGSGHYFSKSDWLIGSGCESGCESGQTDRHVICLNQWEALVHPLSWKCLKI